MCLCVCELWLLLRDTKVLILGGNAPQLATAAAATKSFFLSLTETAKYTHKQIYFHYDCTHTHVLTLLHTHTHINSFTLTHTLPFRGQTVTAPTYYHRALKLPFWAPSQLKFELMFSAYLLSWLPQRVGICDSFEYVNELICKAKVENELINLVARCSFSFFY